MKNYRALIALLCLPVWTAGPLFAVAQDGGVGDGSQDQSQERDGQEEQGQQDPPAGEGAVVKPERIRLILPPRQEPSMEPRVLFFDESFPYAEDAPFFDHFHGNIISKFGVPVLSIRFDRNDVGDLIALYSITPGNIPNRTTQEVKIDGRRIQFATPLLPREAGTMRYEGELSEDGQFIRGEMTMSDEMIEREIEVQNFYRENEQKPPLTEEEEAQIFRDFRPGTFELKRVPRTIDLAVENRIAWGGQILVEEIPFDLVICIAETPGGNWVGHLDIPQQMVGGWPLDAIERDGAHLLVHLGGGAPGVFDGMISEDGETYEGVLRQAMMTPDFEMTTKETPFTLTRIPDYSDPTLPTLPAHTGGPANNRPQYPVPPYPYAEEEVLIAHPGNHSLAGTLTLPQSEGPHPAVVLLSGTGAHDRDQEMYAQRTFFVLADALSRRGVAVLRFDDRGKGKSTGRYNDATVQDFASDAVAAFNFLRAIEGVDPQHIGFVGYGEGAWHALGAAQTVEPAFLVLLAAPGLPGHMYQVEQMRQELLRQPGHDSEAAKALVDANRAFLTVIGTGAGDEEANSAAAALAEAQIAYSESLGADPGMPAANRARMLVVRNRRPWEQSFLAFDPVPLLEALECPVFAAWGSLDRVSPPEANRAPIANAIDGSDRSVARVYDGLNYLFQPAETGFADEYSRSRITMDEQVMLDIARWVRDLARDGG